MIASREIIEHGLNNVAAALNHRPPSSATIDSWVDLFEGENPRLLAACFRRLVEESEKFPTPRRMRSLLSEFKPSGNPALTHTAGVDAAGRSCWFWSDAPTVPTYLAEDCPEGRVCFAKLRELCKQMPPGATEETVRRAELQSQKVQVLRGERKLREPGEEG